MPCAEWDRFATFVAFVTVAILASTAPGLTQSTGQEGEIVTRGVHLLDAPSVPPSGDQNGNSPSTTTNAPSLLTPSPPQSATAPAVAPVSPSAHSNAGQPLLMPSTQPQEDSANSAQPTASAPRASSNSSQPLLTPTTAAPGNSANSAQPLLTPTPEAATPPAVLVTPAPQPSSGAGADTAAARPMSPPPDSSEDIIEPAKLPTQPSMTAADNNHPAPPDLAKLTSSIKIPNSAGLSMQILPGADIAAGSPVSFAVSSKKPGYLIVLDVDAAGKIVQIFPNPMALLVPKGVRENANYLRAGKQMQIPDRDNPYAGFEFVASPPRGTAMVVALLSDRPVQLIDLPDVPTSSAGIAGTVDYLTKFASELRIPDTAGKERLQPANWSLDVELYAIR